MSAEPPATPDAFIPLELPELPPGERWDAALLAAAIGEVVPPECILTRGPEFAAFGKDTSMDHARPDVVVLAREVNHVRHVLHVAQFYRAPVYARGLGSGLSGGAVPARGGIVLDVSAMDRLLEVTPGNRSCRVEPGLTVKRLNELLAPQGLWFPPWPSSHDIASLGGNVAENSGGITSVKYGLMKHWLLGLACVLPGGALLRTGSQAVKDVAGFDLTSLICGSEGLLGVVVEIELRLAPIPPAIGTAVYLFPSDEAALAAAEAVMLSPLTPRTLEFIDAPTLACVVKQLGDEARDVLGEAANLGSGSDGARETESAGAVLAIETDAHTEADALTQLTELGELLEAQGGRRIGLTTDRPTALKLWRVRSELSPACHQLGEYKLSEDIAVPRHRLVEYLRGVKRIGVERGFTWLNYGHVGDGNFHATLMFRDESDPQIAGGRAAIADLCRLAVALGGSITGEHGVGSVKAPYLGLMRDSVHLEVTRRIKHAFDPHGILNPGKWL